MAVEYSRARTKSVMETYELPAAAVSALSDPSLKFELHCISFSHYCDKARWSLRSVGLTFEEVNYLPLAHVPGIIRLQKRFKQAGGKPTASSDSPAATPILAIYKENGQPLCLLQNSNLISRYATLRAAALKLPAAAQLYGGDLSLEEQQGQSGSNDVVVVGRGGQYQAIADLELRLSGTLGVEARRVAYFHLLPIPSLAGKVFYNNSSGIQHWLAWPVYFICSLLLPKALKVNAATANRGQRRLLEEFDFVDQLLLEQAETAGAVEPGNGSGSLPYYLCGSQLSAADIALACLAAPIVEVAPQYLGGRWLPNTKDLPSPLQSFLKASCAPEWGFLMSDTAASPAGFITLQELSLRPTGRYVQELWRLHGPVAQQGGAALAKL